MSMTSAIDQKLTTKMQAAFSSTQDRKNAVHLTAAAGAAIVAMLPIGTDVWALRAAETILICCIASSYGEKLTRSAAKGLMLSSFAQLAGEAAAITALEAAEAARIANPFVVYGIKSGIAVALIESVGKLAISYYEKPDGIGHKLCQGAEAVGLVADVSRVVGCVSKKTRNTIAGATADACLPAGTNEAVSGCLAAGEAEAAGSAIAFTGLHEGFSSGHSESYWAQKAAEAKAEGSKASYDHAMKRLKEAIADRLKDAKA